MENTTPFSAADAGFSNPSVLARIFYAVYDCSSMHGSPSWDLAFIEERFYDHPVNSGLDTGEVYFEFLRKAKDYVNVHFQSGGEYFSLQQIDHPDNLIYMLNDKFRNMFC